MKIIRTTTIIAFSFAIIAGCSQKSENESVSAEEMTEEAVKKMKAEFQENREQFVSESQARLDSLENKLTEVGREIQGESDEVQRKMEATWSNLKQQTATIRSNVDKLENASRESWDKLKGKAADQIDYLESQLAEMEKKLES